MIFSKKKIWAFSTVGLVTSEHMYLILHSFHDIKRQSGEFEAGQYTNENTNSNLARVAQFEQCRHSCLLDSKQMFNELILAI